MIEKCFFYFSLNLNKCNLGSIKQMNEFIQLRLLIHWSSSAPLTCSRDTLTEFHFKISIFLTNQMLFCPGESMRALVSVITHLILSSTSLCSYRKQVVTPHTSRLSAESWMKEKRSWMWSERRLLPGNPVECVLGSEGTKHWSYDNTVREAASCRRISDDAGFSDFKGQ